MTEEEQKDLEILLANKKKRKLDGFDYLVYLSTMSEHELMTCGHRKGNAQAVLDTVNTIVKRLQKLEAEHIKKYPDEK